MTTTATMQGIELEYGTPDGLEAKVLNQLRDLRSAWGDRERPFVITLYVYDETVLVFAGHPAGRVRE